MKYKYYSLYTLLWLALVIQSCVSLTSSQNNSTDRTLLKKSLSNEVDMTQEDNRDTAEMQNSAQIYNLLGRLHSLQNKARECESHLNAESAAAATTESQAKSWYCHVEGSRNKFHFCLCSYSYDCGETQNLYFSRGYAQRMRKANRLLNVSRGADLQCERFLKSMYKDQKWSCSLFKNQNSTVADEEIYCKCGYEATCQHERVVDFF